MVFAGRNQYGIDVPTIARAIGKTERAVYYGLERIREDQQQAAAELSLNADAVFGRPTPFENGEGI